MLDQFLSAHRAELIEQCRVRAAARHVPDANGASMQHGMPLFLEQLIKTLRAAQAAASPDSRRVSGPSDGTGSSPSEIGETAARHGLELQQHGFTVDQVVHDYGDLCQAITELAYTQGVAVNTVEFQTLNRCLDSAIADAVSRFADVRETLIIGREVQSFNERTGVLGHELRNLILVAKHSFTAIKRGKVGTDGATAAALGRSLDGMAALIDRALSDVRVTARMPVQTERVALADLIAQVEITASMEAQTRGCQLSVSSVDQTLAVDVNPHLLVSAVGNLLQNAFKFTQPHSTVALNVYATTDRVRIDVTDQCGGLPQDFEATMFQPFTQGAPDKSGLGLGLSIARRIVESHQGILSVHNLPGLGCVFTIDLPRQAKPGTVIPV